MITMEQELLPPEEFKRNTFHYQKVKQKGNVVIYVQKLPRGNIIGYEVHKIRHRPERHLKGDIIPAGPVLASNNEFGKWAWTYNQYQQARSKLQELTTPDHRMAGKHS